MLARRRFGFTLIELLVVIAIIAILAAILFPVFTKARASAQRSSCASNYKQIALGAQAYAEEYNGNYPPAYMGHWPWGDWNDPPPAPQGLRALNRYVKNKKVFFCPSNLFFTALHYKLYWNEGGNAWWCATSYWGNWLQVGLTPKQIAQNTGHDPYSLLLSDIVCEDGASTPANPKPHPFNSHPSGGIPEGGNYIYNDGHAKWKWKAEMRELITWSGVKFFW